MTEAWVLRSLIEEFQAKYVTAVELASQLGTSSRKVISMLRDRNMPPLLANLLIAADSTCLSEKRQRMFSQRTLKEL